MTTHFLRSAQGRRYQRRTAQTPAAGMGPSRNLNQTVRYTVVSSHEVLTRSDSLEYARYLSGEDLPRSLGKCPKFSNARELIQPIRLPCP